MSKYDVKKLREIQDIVLKKLNESNLSGYQIWKDTGISETTIGNYIKGKTRPNNSNTKLLMSYFENLKKNNMVKHENIKQIDSVDIKESKFINQMSGGFVTVHENGGKDKVIEKQEEQVAHSFEAHLSALEKFHEVVDKNQDYIRQQDEYIARIVRNSYERNERNMDRIDSLIQTQNELIKIIDNQNQKTQERADRMMDFLEKKL